MHKKKKRLTPFLLRAAACLWLVIAGAAGNGTAAIGARVALLLVAVACAVCCAVLAEMIDTYAPQHAAKKKKAPAPAATETGMMRTDT